MTSSRPDHSRYLLALAADERVPEPPRVTSDLVADASSHGLIPILADRLEDPVVKAIDMRLTARQQVMIRHLRRILASLHEHGIRASVLKGPRLAACFYRKPRYRSFSDLDVLVESGELDRALEVIAADFAVSSVPVKRPKADKRDVLMRDSSGMVFNLDLHWNLFSYTQLRGSALGATPAAWADAIFVDNPGLGPYYALPQGVEIPFLAAHAVLDHRFRLILFRDLLEYADGPVDWESVASTASKWGLRSTTYVALSIARRAVGADVPPAFLDDLRPRSETVMLLDRMLDDVDIVTFDGHQVRPLNLAFVLLNDSFRARLGLALRAPVAFPAWRQRATQESRANTSSVLIVAVSNRRRGAEVFGERLSEGLRSRGFMADAVSLTDLGSGVRADLEPITDHRPADLGRFHLRVARALRRRVRDSSPAMVVALGPALRYGILATASNKARLIYVAIGEPSYWVRSPLSAFLHRILLRRADQVIAVSEETKSQLLEMEPRLHGRVYVGHTGVPEELFDTEAASHGGPLRVLLIGALSMEKDPLAALAAIARVENAMLRIVGGGPLRETVEREALRLGVSHRLELTGSVVDVSEHLGWADVLLLSSRTEGLPAAILESGAAGVPSVAFDVGGVREAIVNGRTGFLVSAGDVSGLSDALQRLERDRRLVAEMGRAARDHIRSRFGLSGVIDEYARLLTVDAFRSQ